MNLHNIHVSLKFVFIGIIFEFISLLSVFGSINQACEPFFYLSLASIPSLVCMIIGVVVPRYESPYFKKGFVVFILALILDILASIFLLIPTKEFIAIGLVISVISLAIEVIGNLFYIYATNDVFDQSRNFKLAKLGKKIIYIFIGCLIVSVIFGILCNLPTFANDVQLQIIFCIIRFAVDLSVYILFFTYVLKGMNFTRAE